MLSHELLREIEVLSKSAHEMHPDEVAKNVRLLARALIEIQKDCEDGFAHLCGGHDAGSSS